MGGEWGVKSLSLNSFGHDELCYILDPKDVYGPDFTGETFCVLKEKIVEGVRRIPCLMTGVGNFVTERFKNVI